MNWACLIARHGMVARWQCHSAWLPDMLNYTGKYMGNYSPYLHHSQGAMKFATQISPLLNVYLFILLNHKSCNFLQTFLVVGFRTKKYDIGSLQKNSFVDFMSNSALLYNKGYNFWKVFWPEKFPKTDHSLLTFLSALLALIASLLGKPDGQ